MFDFCLLPDNKFLRKIFVLAIFCIISLVAFLTRSYDCARESLKYQDLMPFTLECAMMYSYSWDIAREGKLPEYDKSLVGQEDVPSNSQMSISLEYFLGYGYKIKEFFSSFTRNTDSSFNANNSDYNINTDFVSWIRIQLRLWISLSAGLIFIWLLLLDSSFLFSILGGLLFAIAPAAIARATGQDIIRENFAIPLILFTFISYYWYVLSMPGNAKLMLLFIGVAMALISWDMTQLCLSLWGIYELITAFFKKDEQNVKSRAWEVIFIACIICGLFNPYLFSHNLIYSPLVIIIIPSLLITLRFSNKRPLTRIISSCAVTVFLFLLWFMFIKNFGFSGNYSHFYSLLLAKIKFANIPPVDPALLDFDSRILWTPALHSATKSIYWHLFHFVVPVFALLAVTVISFRKTRNSFNSSLLMPVVFSIFFFLLFIFMVRFHALAIPFICVSIIVFSEIIGKAFRKKTVRLVLALVLLSLMSSEFFFFMNMERAYNDDYKSQLALIRELNDSSVKNKVVLSDFTLSPMLKAYCGARIVLQPKFEMKGARDAVEEYFKLIYHGTEYEFMEFCRKYAVDYFIFDEGMMGGGIKEKFLHPWSTRYIANAEMIKKSAPVYLFSNKPETLTYFYQLDGQEDSDQNRFLVFKVIYPEDIKTADSLYYNARNFHGGDSSTLIEKAFRLNPASPEIRYLYYTLNNSRWPRFELKSE